MCRYRSHPLKRNDEGNYVFSQLVFVGYRLLKLWTNFGEILWRGWVLPKEELIRFCRQSGFFAGSGTPSGILYCYKIAAVLIPFIRQIASPFLADVWELYSLPVQLSLIHSADCCALFVSFNLDAGLFSGRCFFSVVFCGGRVCFVVRFSRSKHLRRRTRYTVR